MHRAGPGYEQINEWIKEGKLKFRVDVREGLENAPEVFNKLFTGSHDGKLLLKIADA
jgi:NADPH-dependent curcumin reductase CurA